MNVKEQLGQYAARVETYILEQVAAMQKAAAGMDTDMLYDAMRHSLSAGGKRIQLAANLRRERPSLQPPHLFQLQTLHGAVVGRAPLRAAHLSGAFG